MGSRIIFFINKIKKNTTRIICILVVFFSFKLFLTIFWYLDNKNIVFLQKLLFILLKKKPRLTNENQSKKNTKKIF